MEKRQEKLEEKEEEKVTVKIEGNPKEKPQEKPSKEKRVTIPVMGENSSEGFRRLQEKQENFEVARAALHYLEA